MENGIVITADNEISVQEFSRDGHGVLNTDLRRIIGDSLEKVNPMHLIPPFCFMCNEDGLRLELPVNEAASLLYGTYQHGSPIVGNIVILKVGNFNGEPDIVGLSEDEAECLYDVLKSTFTFLKEAAA